MTVEITEDTQSEWIPHEDMSFLSTTGYEPVLRRINKTIDTLLMQVEGLAVVFEVLDVVNVDESVER